ncbi:glycosyltransferase family 4 protein [Aeromonas caviae]
MKVINVSPIWFHKGEGISEVVKNHHATFKKLGVETRLIQTNHIESLALPINNKSLYDAVKEDMIKVTSIVSLLRWLNYYKGEVFIVHGVFQPKILFTLVFLFFMRQKYIVIPHSSLSYNAFSSGSFIKRVLYKSLIQYLLKKSFFVMYLNEDEKVSGIYKNKNVEVFNNGVCVPCSVDYRTNERNLYDGDDIVKLIYFGRYDIKHKGIDYLLSFVNFLDKSKPQFRWTLALYGTDSKNGLKYINSFVESHNLSDKVSVNNAVYGDEKDQVLSSSGVFLLTSRYEGMPIAVLEALKNGVPCLLTKETNMLSPLLDTGIAEEFFIDDFERSYSSLIKLSDPNSREKIRAACHTLVENKYSWEVICKMILNKINSAN